MFGFGAPVITIGVILNIVIIEVTVIICILRDVARDDPVEVSGVVARIRRGRGWSGQLGRGRRMGMTGAAKKTGHSIGKCPTPIRLQYSQQYQSQWTLSCPVF